MIDRLMIGDFIDFSPFQSDFAAQVLSYVASGPLFQPDLSTADGRSAATHDSVARARAVLPLLPPTEERCFFLAESGHFLCCADERRPCLIQNHYWPVQKSAADDCLRGCGGATATMRYRIEADLIG